MSESDFFRDTWVRYLGYANEVGESFRTIVPIKVVHLSYKIAFSYVFADTAHKAFKMYRKDGRSKNVMIATGDAFLWQTLASIIFPGVTINRICHYSQIYIRKYAPKVPPRTRNWITVGIGLASIPIIISPIDATVTAFMNLTYRPFFRE